MHHQRGRLQQWPGQQGARAFAQAHVQVQQRARLQVRQHQVVAALCGAVAKQHVVFGSRGQGTSHQRRAAGNKTIDQNHPALAGSLQHRAGHHGNLKPAQGSQCVQRFGGGCVQSSGGRQHRLFVQQLRVGQAGAAPGGVVYRHPRQAVQQQRGGGGVGNAHFTKSHHIAGPAGQHVSACLQGGMALVRRHGRAPGQVVCAMRDFAFDQLWVVGQVTGHACIDHLQCKAMLPRQHVDGCTPSQHIGHHLHRDSLREGGYTLSRNTVVRCKNQHLRRVKCQHLAALNQTQLQSHLFKLAECTQGLGFMVNSVL